MIELIDITKIFNENEPNEFCALKELSFKVEDNSIFALKGISGSGKSTVLSIIAGIAKPSLGEVLIDDVSITKLSFKFADKFRRKYIGLIFQNFNLIPTFNILENVLLPTLPDGGGKKERALELLSYFKLTDKKEVKAKFLSGGEQQRVAIIRALINDPKYILADEPTANLDLALSKDLLKYFEEIRDMGKTIIIASHDPLVLESSLISSTYEMKRG